MTKKHTKKALFSSVLALILCFAMLIGTTFAWFTDSVSSANNLIQSGNLDVELYWSKDGKAWEKVNTNTNVFEKEALWEPGYTEVAYLRVANEGTLNLKYQLGANVVSEVGSTNVAGDDFMLSDHIMYGVAETATVYADRDAARNAVTNPTTLANSYSSDVITLAPKQEKVVALVVYMPETVGNEANYMTGATVPQIVLGLNVLATQVEAELDSFGNDYDLNATLPEGTLSAPSTASSNVRADGSVTLNVAAAPSEITKLTTVEAPAGTYKEGQTVEMSVSTANTLFNVSKDGFTVASLDVSLKVDGDVQTGAIGGLYTVTTYISKGLNDADIIVKYTGNDGAQPTKVSYDANTGKLVFTTNHFSTYEVSAKGWAYDKNDKAYTTIEDVIENIDVVIIPDAHKADIFNAAGATDEAKEAVSSAKVNGVSYLTAEEAFEASTEGSTITLKAGTYQFAGNTIKKGVTIEGTDGVVFNDTLKGNLEDVTIKNVHIEAANAQRWAYSKGTLVFEDCTFEATSVYAIHYDGLNGANITYKNCEIIGWVAIGGGAEHITFDSCTIKGNGTYGLIRLYSPGTIKNCTFDVANVNTTDVYQDGVHAVDCQINVENCTNVNGDVTALFNTSGTGTIVNNGVAYVEKPAGLNGALANGGSTTLSENVALTEHVVVAGGTLDGNGMTIDASDADTKTWGNYAVTLNDGGTVQNVTVENAFYGVGSTNTSEDIYIKNVTIDNVTYAINGNGNGTASVYVTDSTIYGWCSYSGVKLFSFENCTLGMGNSDDGYLVVYGDTAFTNCNFEDVFDMCARDEAAGATVSFTDCTYDGVKVTAENFKSLFMYPGDDEDFGKLINNCSIVIDGVTVAFNTNNLNDALADGGDVVLTEDITTENNQSSNLVYNNSYGVSVNGGVLDGAGNTISAPEDVKYTVVVTGGTVQNATIDSGERGIVTYSPTEDVIIENVVVNGPGYAFNSSEHGAVKLIVNNSTLNGWTSFAGFSSASFADCKFGENTAKYWQNMGYAQDYDRLMKPYVNTVFTDCVFELNFYIDLSALGADCTVTLSNCTVNGTVITANNYSELVTIELPEGRTLADCVVFA